MATAYAKSSKTPFLVAAHNTMAKGTPLQVYDCCYVIKNC